jgi:hypothetical protein
MWKTALENGMLGQYSLEKLRKEDKILSYLWREAVLMISKFLLLQTTSPAALVRIHNSKLQDQHIQLCELYESQHHESIKTFLEHVFSHEHSRRGLLLQVTTHSHLLLSHEVEKLLPHTEGRVFSYLLQEFDTELDFNNKIGPLFVEATRSSKICLLVIQCDSGHINSGLIACARHRIYDMRAEALLHKPNDSCNTFTHVLFIIHLPIQAVKSSFVGFQSEPWISYHIDELRTSEGGEIHQRIGNNSISKLFYEDNATRSKVCVRLNHCIQAAACQVQDSTHHTHRAAERIKLLIDVIPHDPKFPLDLNSFYGILVSHIHRILKERDSVVENSNWILHEAMSKRRLQIGGTFSNVLSRRLDNIIVPIFSKIIAFLDRSCNLSLLQSDKLDTPLCQLWLKVFQSNRVEQELCFEYNFVMQKVPVTGKEFICQFPFSMLFIELIDSQWDDAKGLGGSSTEQLHQQLCTMVSETPLGETLTNKMDRGQCETLYRCYLHDFVHFVHKCPHRIKENQIYEYKLIEESLHHIIASNQEFKCKESHMMLTNKLVAVHVVYRANSGQIHWFGQLTTHSPGILSGLVHAAEQHNSRRKDGRMMLHLYALERVLNGLKPPVEPKRKSSYSIDDTLRNWLNTLQTFSLAIESILSLTHEFDPITTKAMHKWQKTKAIQMFTEHVLLNHCDMIPFASRLDTILGDEANFLQCKTVEQVKLFLNNMYRALRRKKKSGEEKKELAEVRRNCYEFFIHVVSSLCFGQSISPDDDLTEMLLDVVFKRREEVGDTEGEMGKWRPRHISPYEADVIGDASPIIHSFLLKLLLEHNTEKTKCHLNVYFERSRQSFMESEKVDLDLCLLSTQCFEDALQKENSAHPLGQKMDVAIRLMASSVDTLTQCTSFTLSNISMKVLEGVAKMRYGLLVVAELLQLQANPIKGVSFSNQSQNIHGRLASTLLDTARYACTSDKLNIINTSGSAAVGPIVYLLKLLVRQAGISCLNKLVAEHSWVVPLNLKKTEEEQIAVPFTIYNPIYVRVREIIRNATYHEDYTALENLQPKEEIPLILSVYEVVTLSRTSALPSKQLRPQVLEQITRIILNRKFLPNELQDVVRTLVSNQHSGTLAAFHVSPDQPHNCRILSAIVIHTVVSLLSKRKIDLLCPLVTLITQPRNMVDAYLPTMPEDMLAEARRIISGGKFYECPKGHPYHVGECGRPTQRATCHICGSGIGGLDHHPEKKNKLARTSDISQKGHCLGHPSVRGHVPSSERLLSAAACCILRAILHSVLIWSSCNKPSATKYLEALVKSGLQKRKATSEFFWGHLERDVQQLSIALGKNNEEAAIVVHLVLQRIATCEPKLGIITSSMKILKTRTDRHEWENQFGTNYIQPVLEKLEDNLYTAMDSILKCAEIGDASQLYLERLVYERLPVEEGSLEPHLWGYRPPITLEHLTRYMHQQTEKFPVLEEFIKEETVLRATHYLPNIVCLQRRLYNEFHHRIDHKTARNTSMRVFIMKKCSENMRKEYYEMVASVQSAWLLVRDKLKNHAQLTLKDEYLQHDISLESTLEYFIPTTVGPGACTFALVHYLVYVHNNFIEWCKNHNQASTWHEHKVELQHIHMCHLIDYYSQLQSILLSHCHYSLRVGRGHNISYNLPTLQKHLLDRFIFGRPRILVDIPHVSYQKDIYTTATFATVRKTVAQQVTLDARERREILQELRSPDELRKSLDVVEIVLGFLTSGGGKPKTRLVTYLNKLKMEKRIFSEKAKQYCNLEHILSLWETLSVGLAKTLTLNGQEPFDTLPDQLVKPLSHSQHQQLDRVLHRFDLDSLLGTLYEFIETFIRHTEVEQQQWGLVDTLQAHLEIYNLNMLIATELKELPNDITLAQTVAMWKYIVVRPQGVQ